MKKTGAVKKIIFIVLFIILILAYILVRLSTPHKGEEVNPEVAYNSLREYNIVEEMKPLNKIVTRLDFTIAVLRTIGANDTLAYDAFDTDFDPRYIRDMSVHFKNSTYTQCGYIFLATEWGNSYRIVYGKTRKDQFFDPYPRPVFAGYDFISVRDASAICARCLTMESDPSAFKEYQNAREYGLINNTDLFATVSGENYLRYKDMYVLLYRLLNQKRCKYFLPVDKFLDSQDIDENRSITYAEYLTECIENDVGDLY